MKALIKPKRLKKGDTVAIVSPSSGMLGDEALLHKYQLGKKRLEEKFGLRVVAMPNALKGSEYLYEHPEKRAEDFMEAFRDPQIDGVLSAIGGEDAIRLLPYLDYGVIHDHPKIFTGLSDMTANHLMLFKAGVVSYYGAGFMTEFAAYGEMPEYSETAFRKLLMDGEEHFEIQKCPYWMKEDLPWREENIARLRPRTPDPRGDEMIQGGGRVRGRLLGGCVDAFPMYNGTEIWPGSEDWTDTVLFLETSGDCPSPAFLSYYLRNLGAQGAFDQARGILVGKPVREKYYEEYKDVYRKILKEFRREDMPVLYNVSFGHCSPVTILPYGISCELDTDRRKITLLESVVE